MTEWSGAKEPFDKGERRLKKLAWNNFQKINIMASGLITSWQIDGETMESERLYLGGAPKSLQMVTAAMKLKNTYSLEEKLWPI